MIGLQQYLVPSSSRGKPTNLARVGATGFLRSSKQSQVLPQLFGAHRAPARRQDGNAPSGEAALTAPMQAHRFFDLGMGKRNTNLVKSGERQSQAKQGRGKPRQRGLVATLAALFCHPCPAPQLAVSFVGMNGELALNSAI